MRRAALLLLAACGRIGFDATDADDGPTMIGMSDLVVAGGDEFTCAIRPDRGVWCWGDGHMGELGNGQLEVATTPTASLVTGARALAAGERHACALLMDGRMLCWGNNGYGQLAQAGGTAYPTPTEITGLPAAIDQIVLGFNHTCAILTDHSLWCWGRNYDGELGVVSGTGTVRTPQHVLDDVIEAGAGDATTCAIRSDHSLWCWGSNTHGQLGDGTIVTRTSPAPVPGFTADHVSIGDFHTCAITGDQFTCWGYNNNGELGDGTFTERHAPGPLSALAGFVQIAAGNDHNCGLLGDGRVVCWGDDEDGAVGDGMSFKAQTLPVVVAAGNRVAHVTVGGQHACALRDDGSVACWGYGSSGQLGNGVHSEWAPVKVTLPAAASQIAAGDHHACALVGFDVYCWGDDLVGALGNGGTEVYAATPVKVALTASASTIVGGGRTSCALAGSQLWCWGANSSGQLADGTQTKRSAPVVSMFSSPTPDVALGAEFGCGLQSSGGTQCWGSDDLGQVGDGGGANHLTPYTVNVMNTFAVAAGSDHACALTGAGTLLCWGDNASGQVGIGAVSPIELPKQVSGMYAAAAAGGEHTCAITATATALMCWGENNFGQLGDGTATNRPAPTAVSSNGTPFGNVLALGMWHTCNVTTTGFYCWGRNTHGELGDGTGVDSATPRKVMSVSPSQVVAGRGFTCALDGTGTVWCWGDNARGQLGQGTTTRSLVPIDVTFP